ncbi:MAG: phenylalanine--tRNA ligase subunit alpha [Candidatus Spyradosoma sp.]
MQAQLEAIISETETAAPGIATRPEFDAFKARVSGPNGSLTQVMKSIGKLPKEEKPAAGKLINAAKQRIDAALAAALARIEENELAAKLGEPVDPTQTSPDDFAGSAHPLTQVREEICRVFHRLGFTIAEGPELESEWYCFDALNTPESHPARDMQDTLFLPAGTVAKDAPKKGDEAYIMRSHTSSVQIRTMLSRKPPIRVIAPGRCFRRDTVDATHSANFHQVEGLWVDRNVTLKDLKSVLDSFVREIFGSTVETRLRPSFFPFTEPSFEMDIKSPNLGRLSDRWLEIMGCGLVDPKVFENVGIDAGEWTGLAFGVGLERIAMLVHGIDDIRHFYANDLRFLRQFA